MRITCDDGKVHTFLKILIMKSHPFYLVLLLFPCVVSAQNVGIGIAGPTAKLHVNGSVKLEGLNLFEFGAGVGGKELNAGKIGYNAFGTNALAFVGAGTSTSNRAVYFFAEGGTTFTGPATIAGNTNIGGQLQLNGNPGTAGQVIVSNGTSDPGWQNTAYGNNTRFATSFSSTVSTGAWSLSLTSQYNLNSGNITIGTNSITINKTGLYHFESHLHYLSSSTTQPLFYLWMNGIYGAGTNFYFLREELVPYASVFSYNYRGNWNFALDVHITAPATISMNVNSLNMNTSSVLQGDFIGHLIND